MWKRNPLVDLEPRLILCRKCKLPGGTLIKVGGGYEHDRCQHPNFPRKVQRLMR